MRLTILDRDGTPATGRSWEDTDAARIEDHLGEILVTLIVAGERYYRSRAQAQYEWRLQHRAELQEEVRQRHAEDARRERERLAKIERERLERLFNAASAWRQAADLRAFIDAVRAANRDTTAPEALERLTRWTADAQAAADRLDPLRTGELRFGEIRDV